MGEGSDRHASTTTVEATAADDATGLAFRTATELAEALAQRKISARELLDSAISRIEALDPKINAVVVRDFDRARTAADGPTTS